MKTPTKAKAAVKATKKPQFTKKSTTPKKKAR